MSRQEIIDHMPKAKVKKYTLTEEQMNQVINTLAEIPLKYVASLWSMLVKEKERQDNADK